MGQRWIIRDLHRRFQPDAVTTTMPLYQSRLSGIGITAKVLPLFGNIPIAPRDDDRIAGLLQSAGSRIIRRPRTEFLNGVFFGTVHPDFDAAPLIQWLAELRSQTAKPFLLSLVGRTGMASEHLAKKLARSSSDAIEVVSLGEQPEEIISQALQFADFGINTGSSKFLWKSGTFAAMQEHGLPVVLRDGRLDSTILKNRVSPVLQFSTNGSVSDIINYIRLPNPCAGVSYSAANLIRCFHKICDKTTQTVHS